MIDNHEKRTGASLHDEKKLVLVLMPFWPPLIPPLGIACLKAFLQRFGYEVKTFDANVDVTLKNIYSNYLEILKAGIPADKRGNYYNTANEVMQAQMMAYLHYKTEGEYQATLQTVIRQHFFTDAAEQVLIDLHETIKRLYLELEIYILRLLEVEKPTLTGFSVFRDTLPASMFACKLVKNRYPHIKTVMGGAIFSQSLEEGSPNFKSFLEEATYVDKIIIGEGENLFLDFLQEGFPPSQKVSSIKSIAGKVLDITRAGIPDFSDFSLDFYPYLAAYTSRSCPYKCSFCAETIYWGKYRKKSPQQVIGELTGLYEQYRTQLYLMCDSLLNPFIMELSQEMLKSERIFYWDGYLRADKNAGEIENTILWRRAGFYRARLGVESGSRNVLNLMGKKITPSLISSSLFNLAAAGIKTTTYWIVGYPGETHDDFQQTLDLVAEMKDYIYEAECNPFTYFVTGQAGSPDFARENRIVPLYPGKMKEMLMTQTWILDGQPTRAETFERLAIFEEHCKKMGIPNPYSLHDIYMADVRWKNLHDNAVPPITVFKNTNIAVDECRKIKKFSPIEYTKVDNGDFGF